MITPQTPTVDIDDTFQKMKHRSHLLRFEHIAARVAKLKVLKQWIKNHQQDIETALVQDFRKPPFETATSEVMMVVQEIQHALKHLKTWAKPKRVGTPPSLIGTSSYVQYEPKGVCLIMAPWNYPFQLLVGPWVSAIAAGNCCVLKPSEMTPHTAALIARMVEDLFEPEEAAVFQGGSSVAEALLKKPFDHIYFTGSPAIGKKVMAAAAQHLSSVTLELGGKSPAVVDKDADLEAAAEKIVWGKFLNAGQTCIAPDYVLVHQEVQDALVDKLCEKIEAFYYTDSNYTQQAAHYAGIISDKHFDRLTGWLEDAIAQDAVVEIGGQHEAENRYFAPTVLTRVPNEASLMQEEIFGPILPVRAISSMAEAADYVNSKPKPLALYMFSEDDDAVQLMLQSTSSGSVCVNDCILQFVNLDLPFGGVNNSGIGKGNGHYGFLAFSNEKSVLRQEIGSKLTRFFYPPLAPKLKGSIDFMIQKLL